ncbi:unnamed protein product [Cuscuta europaea]|uniref:F-box domain-containing protein n=1 Tax=Cuscuta europaea TaxID=41803 RepID=A0A9P1EK00_CUSEU|nr:unnamed protein product [Cuscuta europaea]
MATLRSRTTSDLISELPEDVKHRILECLDTREAAKTSILSTQWNDVWLRHGQLFFDKVLLGEGEGVKCSKMITNALILRSGPVKKFTLDTSKWEPALQQCDLDLWCRFLSRNGIEQLNLFVDALTNTGDKYTLPVCIISCPTIKKLQLYFIDIRLPDNPRPGSMFSGVTSLEFNCVEFYRDNSPTVIHLLAHLEVLVFLDCHYIDNFLISAPSLNYLNFIDTQIVAEWKWFELHFRVIKTLCFCAYTFLYNIPAAINMQERLPIAKNLQVIELHDFSFAHTNCFTLVIHLLRKCPKLCELEIIMITPDVSNRSGEADPCILRDPDGWFSDQDLSELRTVKMISFSGLRQEMLFIKLILSKAPFLQEVLISESAGIDTSVTLEVQREMTSFPHASPKAKVVFVDPS